MIKEIKQLIEEFTDTELVYLSFLIEKEIIRRINEENNETEKTKIEKDN